MPKAITLSPDQLELIKQLFLAGHGDRAISAQLKISRWMIQKGYHQLNLKKEDVKPPLKLCLICFKQAVTKKYCSSCKQSFGVKLCERAMRNGWREEEIAAVIKDRKIKKYQASKKWRTEKLKADPAFRLRGRVSNSINNFFKKSLNGKLGASSIHHLPFSMQELKKHLESLFEPWMTWNNWGAYNKDSWDDNDSSTWKWQIDHIIPHSYFNYQSMTDPQFHQCWQLSNLQPLSAKKNLLKGCRKN